MKRLIWLLLISTGFAQTISTLNGTTVGTSAGNISGWNGTTIGTTAGNIGAWNGLTSPGGGGGSNPTLVQSVAGNNGSGATSLTVSITSSGANHAIVAWLARLDGTPVLASPTTTGTSCTLTEVAGTKQTTTVYFSAWVGTNCGSGVTGVTVGGGFQTLAMVVQEISNANTTTPVDVSASHDNGFAGGATMTSTATGAMASGNGIILGGHVQFRGLSGNETANATGSFTADKTTNNNATGLMLFTETWAQPGTTTGQACTASLNLVTGGEQAYSSCLVIK